MVSTTGRLTVSRHSAPVIVFAVLILLASTLSAMSPEARAGHGEVHADAGDSAFIPEGTDATVAGYAVGDGPFSYHWTHLGSDARFADPTAQTTGFNTSGLAEGGHNLTLTATDSQGNAASDTVRVFVYHPREVALVDASGTLLTGVPFVITPADARSHNFTVPPGALQLDLTLDWGSGANDLDLYVDDPSGRYSNTNDGATLNKPETLSLKRPAAGEWSATVDGFTNSAETYTLNVTVLLAPDDPRPRAAPFGPYIYGVNETQTLRGEARGAGHSTGAWDLDGDGVFESAGLVVDAAYAVGEHAPTLKVTNDDGYEARRATTMTVVENLGVPLHCRGVQQPNSVAAMEVEHLAAGCWGHLGHHTYFPGRDRVLTLGDGEGRVFTVEVQLAPPTETMAGATVATTTTNGDPAVHATADVDAPVAIETSLDGIAWNILEAVRYDVTTVGAAVAPGDPGLSWSGVPMRQNIHFSFDGDEREFRYLRVRQPLSASQGLSGYIDYSDVRLEALDARSLDVQDPVEEARTLSCREDIVEDVFASHPCWFGGINRYDSPSAMHTYPLGDAAISSVSGHVAVAPWRSDDWWSGRDAGDWPYVSVGLYASADGATWTRLATMEGAYGAPLGFNLTLDGPMDARFIRLIPDPHQRYWEHPALKHMQGYVVDSELTVSGVFNTEA